MNPIIKFDPDPQAVDIVRRLRIAADTLPWKGQTGRTDRNVYNAALRFAEDTSCLTVRLAQREMMIQAGIGSRSTVRKSMARLHKRRLIRNSGGTREWDEGTPYTLTKWLLRDQPPMRQLTYLSNPEVILMPGSPLHVWLGNPAVTIYAALTDTPVSRNDLAEKITKMGRDTAGRALNNLERELLAVRTPDGWIRGITLAQWDQLNPDHPGRDRTQVRHLAIQREREDYRRNHAEKANFEWIFHKDEWWLIDITTGEVISTPADRYPEPAIA